MPDPSILERLKERKIVQWSAAYLAGAFVAFQAVEVLADPWGISATLQRAVHILLVFGLFITLVLAWYHGEKGRQRASGPELLMITLLLVIAGGVLSTRHSGRETDGPLGIPEAGPQPDAKPSIIVLACDNISPNPDDAYLADGLHEAIIHRLAGVDELSVFGRETAKWYRENPKPPAEIASERDLDFVGECSIRKDPNANRILVTFQLLDSRGVHVWSNEFVTDLAAADLFDVQRNIAQQVTIAVGATLSPADEAEILAEATESDGAYDSYLRGGFFLAQRTEAGLINAIRQFEDAIRQDSAFALAYAGLADAYALSPFYGTAFSVQEARDRASLAVEKALLIDDRRGEPFSSLGYIREVYDWDEEAAEEAYQRAILLSPGYATAHQWYGGFLSRQGRTNEGLAHLRSALELDPLSLIININLADALSYAGRLGEAEERYRIALGLYPESPLANTELGWLLVSKEDYEAALQLGPNVSQVSANLARGQREEALALAAQFTGGTLRQRVEAAMALGEIDLAFRLLDQAVREHHPWLAYFDTQLGLEPLHADPRFGQLLRRIGRQG